MDQKERRMYLLKYLLAENPQAGIGRIPDEEKEQKALLRGLMNIRMPQPHIDLIFIDGHALRDLIHILFDRLCAGIDHGTFFFHNKSSFPFR